MLQFYAGIGTPGTAGFAATQVTAAAIAASPQYDRISTYSQPYGDMLQYPKTGFNNREQYLDAPATSVFDIINALMPTLTYVGDIPASTVIDFYADAAGQYPYGFKLYIEDDGTNYTFVLANKKWGQYYNVVPYGVAKADLIPDYSSFTEDVEMSKKVCFLMPNQYKNAESWEQVFALMFVAEVSDYEAETYEYLPMALKNVPLLFGYGITHRYWAGGDNYVAVGIRGDTAPNVYYRAENYHGLSTIGAWMQFMFDAYLFNTGGTDPVNKEVSLDLEEPINGIDRIIIGKALYWDAPDLLADNGYTDTAGVAIKEYTMGTDLLELIGHDFGTDHVIRLKNGDTITITADYRVKIEAANKELTWEYSKQTGDGVPFDNANNGYGLYLVCPYSFEFLDKEGWLADLVGYSQYEYGNAPIFLASYVGIPNPNQPLKTNFWDYTNHPNIGPAGLITAYNYSYYTTAKINAATDANYDFWEELLANLHSDEPEPPAPYDPGEGHPGGGDSGPGGGNGDWDDDSEDVDPAEPPTNATPNTFKLYRASRTDIDHLMEFINSAGNDDTRAKYVNAVMSVKLLAIPMSMDIDEDATAEDVKLAGTQVKYNFLGTQTDLQLNRITDQFISGDIGSFTIGEYFGNFLDYTHTKIKLWLPFVGFNELNTVDIIGNECTLHASIDLLTGILVYQLKVKEAETGKHAVLYTWSGNVGADYPLTAIDYNGKIANKIGMYASMAGLAIGVAGLILAPEITIPMLTATAGSLAGVASSANALSKANVGSGVSSGDVSGSAGFMQKRYPYLVISRPKQNVPASFGHEYGFKSHITATIGDLTGFTVVEDVHLTGFATATAEELDLITQKLTEGFII